MRPYGKKFHQDVVEVTRPRVTSRDLLYSRVPRINATVLYTQIFATGVDLISVLILRQEEILEAMDRDCGEVFRVYTYL